MGRSTRQNRQSRARASVAQGGAAMSAHQGASHTDLALRDWQPFAGSADADLLPELDTLTSRSRDLARNDGLMAGGIQTHRDNVVARCCAYLPCPITACWAGRPSKPASGATR